MKNNLIEISSLSKNYHTKYGEIPAIEEINLNIDSHDIIAILGPSGCGKSTLLSIIAGLDKESSGVVNKKKDLSIAYMLQNDALFNHLTIYENALLGLKIKKLLDKEHLEYVDYLFDFYKLNDFKDKYPSSLSGGMKQRVALIRTLATKPDLLLLDEPFSALDSQTRIIICNDVYKIVRKEKKAVVLVTHSIEEAIIFADKVIVLSNRPSKIKNIYDIKLEKNSNINERRESLEYTKYFNSIWKDLDLDE